MVEIMEWKIIINIPWKWIAKHVINELTKTFFWYALKSYVEVFMLRYENLYWDIPAKILHIQRYHDEDIFHWECWKVLSLEFFSYAATS